MVFTDTVISQEELNSINNFFEQYENQVVKQEEVEKESSVSKYLHSLVTNCYAQSIKDIANTKVGNRITRKRNLQQVMRESFFYGANRFGNNFIA